MDHQRTPPAALGSDPDSREFGAGAWIGGDGWVALTPHPHSGTVNFCRALALRGENGPLDSVDANYKTVGYVVQKGRFCRQSLRFLRTGNATHDKAVTIVMKRQRSLATPFTRLETLPRLTSRIEKLCGGVFAIRHFGDDLGVVRQASQFRLGEAAVVPPFLDRGGVIPEASGNGREADMFNRACHVTHYGPECTPIL